MNLEVSLTMYINVKAKGLVSELLKETINRELINYSGDPCAAKTFLS